MQDEWMQYNIEDLIADEVMYIGDGYRAKNSELSSVGIPFARGGNINDGFRFDDTDRFPEDDLHKVGVKISSPGDVVFTSKGTVGRFAFVQEDTERFVYSPQLSFWRSLNHEIIWPRYLYYWMYGREFFIQYFGVKGQTDMADYVSLRDQRRMYITLPSLSEQRAIAHILGTLDDKIELNRRENATLEAMARAIFRSWFVDFDPVHAKASGEQPSGMDAATASLFPDSFEESELGPIPREWKVVTIGDVADIKHGYAFKGEYFHTEPPGDILLTPGNFAIGGGFKGDKFKYYAGPIPEEYILAKSDLLVTMTDLSKESDTLGYPLLVPSSNGPRYLHNQRLGKVIIKSESFVSESFLYSLFRTPEYRYEILAGATGTTVKHTAPKRIQGFQFSLPPESIMIKFTELADSLYGKLAANDEESFILAELRDTLLPKLISGELRVGEIDDASTF